MSVLDKPPFPDVPLPNEAIGMVGIPTRGKKIDRKAILEHFFYLKKGRKVAAFYHKPCKKSPTNVCMMLYYEKGLVCTGCGGYYWNPKWPRRKAPSSS